VGQTIQINRTDVIGDVVIVDTDRTLTGQDGEVFDGEAAGETFAARLAGRIFEEVPGVDHVYVMSNTVTVRRPGGWEDGALDRLSELVAGFFRFYPD